MGLHELTETFQRDDREIARARRVIRTALGAWGLDDDAAVMELLVSELVSNSVVHGQGQIVVRLSSDGQRVRLEVADDGRTGRPLPGSPAYGEVGGWGLRFVDQLAERWGTRHDGAGTLVWTETRQSPPGGGGHASDTS